MKTWLLLLTMIFTTVATANDLTQDLDSLGGNQDLIRKARAVSPNNRLSIVQDRVVDRTMRLELGGAYSYNYGGDPHINTDTLGVNLDFHINPKWSIGGRFATASNTLTSEGQRVLDSGTGLDIDYPKQTYMGVLSWYPIYGKLNIFDITTAQFDLYVLGGYGQIVLSKGSSDIYTVGGGIGLWLAQNISARLEARHQSYKDQVYLSSRQVDQTVISASIGFLL